MNRRCSAIASYEPADRCCSADVPSQLDPVRTACLRVQLALPACLCFVSFQLRCGILGCFLPAFPHCKRSVWPVQRHNSGCEGSLFWPHRCSGDCHGPEPIQLRQQGPVFYRPLCPTDFASLKAGHAEAFPLDYEDDFFLTAVGSDINFVSWGAIQHSRNSSRQAFIGFITARYIKLHDCDPTDRAALGLSSRLLDAQEVVYILTLGVAEEARRRGVAGQLLRLVISAAGARGCRACFLHVITYNHAAISFYLANAFEQLAQLRDFYYISTGRQPDPMRTHYDAYLFACPLNEEGSLSVLAYMNTAMIPFRALVDSWAGACGSWMQPACGPLPSRTSVNSAPPMLNRNQNQRSWLYDLFSRY